jgi:hypothetical protein
MRVGLKSCRIVSKSFAENCEGKKESGGQTKKGWFLMGEKKEEYSWKIRGGAVRRRRVNDARKENW